ncbi:hypothetical protein KC342_g2 [Hortaea werneckii]|nr:hypothetical protein KC342_g2 [Hortaea werneckii]
MTTLSLSSRTEMPNVVRIQRSQKTPSIHANPTSLRSISSMLIRMDFAERRPRWSLRSSASSMRSCFASRSSWRSSWNAWVCLSIHSRAAFLISRLSLRNSSGRSRERMARTTRRPEDMISLALEEDFAVVAHGLRGEGGVVGWFAVAGDEEAGPGGDFEAVAEEGVVGFDESGVADEGHYQAFESREVFGGGGVVVEVEEDDFFFLFHLFELGGTDSPSPRRPSYSMRSPPRKKRMLTSPMFIFPAICRAMPCQLGAMAAQW